MIKAPCAAFHGIFNCSKELLQPHKYIINVAWNIYKLHVPNWRNDFKPFLACVTESFPMFEELMHCLNLIIKIQDGQSKLLCKVMTVNKRNFKFRLSIILKTIFLLVRAKTKNFVTACDIELIGDKEYYSRLKKF